MLIYFIIFAILSFTAFRESNNPKPLSIYSFIFLTILFTFFIGLRYEIGCDWESFKWFFDFSNCTYDNSCSISPGAIQKVKSQGIGYRLLTLIIKTFGGSFYSLNFVSALLFVIPLLKFCTNFSRPHLAILISYPYLITVIGLGTIRQSIAIAFLLLCIDQLKKYQFLNFYILNFFSILFHYSSSIFLFLPFLIDLKKRGNLKLFRLFLYVVFLIFIVLVIFSENNYFKYQLHLYVGYNPIPIASPLLIWTMIAIPSAIIILNYKFFKDFDTTKFWRNYSIIGILMIFPIFINKVIALRLLLYFLPIKIYCLSKLPELLIYKISPKYVYLSIIFFSFLILTIWFNFANHSYCYLPYKNLLLR